MSLDAVLAVPGASIALQAIGSLIAVLLVFVLVRALGMGSDVRIADELEACALAEEARCGFDPVEVALDRARIGALLRNAAGEVILIRRHGARFAARVLSSHAGVRLDRGFLTLSTDDRHFGSITLDLGEKAQVWAASLRRLGARA
ncbi:hypothetical protein NSE01_15110 [Novosphingobium sediminis]|uniref:Uncharacterized protein n=1 Tax=Novosphingobium sediminis TaxID=707214 RepID=A0A512AJ02_9SPHN|nr:hypothetical protein [Novosphingobium sediminis]GEN99678.1 hypothetical protein NSE01_15110 [Novosphingobium sediminis]